MLKSSNFYIFFIFVFWFFKYTFFQFHFFFSISKIKHRMYDFAVSGAVVELRWGPRGLAHLKDLAAPAKHLF